MTDIWGYSASSMYAPGTDLNGYTVEATDGTVGKVDDATDEVGSAYIVVNCKPWLVGKHVMLPAGTITRIDRENETIHVGHTKDQIKNAPEYQQPATDVMGGPDAGYLTTLGSYYSDLPR